MKIRQQLKNWGGSLAVIIPIKIIKSLNANEGDYIIIDIIRKESAIKQYRCRKCNYKITIINEDDDLYCPACGCVDLKLESSDLEPEMEE
jgi:Zn finger protein HypA/HybF involved in hydrogenase expression